MKYLLLLSVLVSCATPLPKRVAAVDMMEESPSIVAGALVRHPRSSCDVLGGLPIVLTEGRPVIGRPFRASWSLRPTSPPEPEYQFSVLMFSINNMASPHPIPGAPGCLLMVHPDHLMIPAPGTLLTQDGGRIELRMTAPPQFLGLTFDMQLAVRDTRNTAGIVVSPMLRLIIGDK
tara:strand:- start:8104 stop:8631 length:528 start_codon:yes stop_codon:yes gene_type:complete